MESGCVNPGILDLGTSWWWVDSFTTRSLYPLGKSPQYLMDRRPRNKLVVGGQLHDPVTLLPGKEPPMPTEVGPRTGLDDRKMKEESEQC
jgi:hypothetical protein